MPRKAATKCGCGCGYSPAAVSRTRPLVCPVCGYLLRVSRSDLSRGLPTCPCGAAFRAPCVYDCEVLGPDAVAAHPVAQRELRSLIAATERDRRVTYRAMQCGGCRRFIRAANETCSCGFANDLRGGRNVGGYVDPTQGCDAIPF